MLLAVSALREISDFLHENRHEGQSLRLRVASDQIEQAFRTHELTRKEEKRKIAFLEGEIAKHDDLYARLEALIETKPGESLRRAIESLKADLKTANERIVAKDAVIDQLRAENQLLRDAQQMESERGNEESGEGAGTDGAPEVR